MPVLVGQYKIDVIASYEGISGLEKFKTSFILTVNPPVEIESPFEEETEETLEEFIREEGVIYIEEWDEIIESEEAKDYKFSQLDLKDRKPFERKYR